MALFVKQDFTPPLLSRKWISIKCRPNMLLQCRNHVISILESGLMFREDSARVEQESPLADDMWQVASGGRTGWLTRGERILSFIAVGVAVGIFPPKMQFSHRNILVRIAIYATLPVSIRIAHRLLARGSTLTSLIDYMRDYLALARRTMACLKEYKLLHKGLDSIAKMLESTVTLLWRQQTELSMLMARSSSTLLGNFPWLYEDVDWEAVWKVTEDGDAPNESELVRIHHAFLVIQSTLLKHIAMAHFIQPSHVRKRYLNHNERLYWLHNELLENLNIEFKDNYEGLDRMYRLLRNYGTNDVTTVKKTGIHINRAWLYSEVHSDVARASIELKLALNKSTNLDMFLDSCAINKQRLDLVALNKDIDDLIEDVTKCLSTVQNSQIRLKKLQSKFDDKIDKRAAVDSDVKEVEEVKEVVKIDDDIEHEPKDEVFYFVKTEDDERRDEAAEDLTTGPGKKERDTTEVVLKELRRKLVKREDVMRERERKALCETMPELRNNLPEFPRQIEVEEEERKESKGYISKVVKVKHGKRFRFYKIHHHNPKSVKNFMESKTYQLQRKNYSDLSEIGYFYESKIKSLNIISVDSVNKILNIIIWLKCDEVKKIDLDSGDLSDEELEIRKQYGDLNRKIESNNFKFSRKDLEWTPSSSESDEEYERLKDVRRNRVARPKNYPTKRGSATIDKNDVDESLKPMEYSFGTGMAMASVLQVNKKLLPMAQEEVFIGDGEVSEDSGNDEDA